MKLSRKAAWPLASCCSQIALPFCLVSQIRAEAGDIRCLGGATSCFYRRLQKVNIEGFGFLSRESGVSSKWVLFCGESSNFLQHTLSLPIKALECRWFKMFVGWKSQGVYATSMELTFNLNEHKNFSSLEESVSVLSGKFMQIFNVAVFIRQIQSYYKAKKHKSNTQLIWKV